MGAERPRERRWRLPAALEALAGRSVLEKRARSTGCLSPLQLPRPATSGCLAERKQFEKVMSGAPCPNSRRELKNPLDDPLPPLKIPPPLGISGIVMTLSFPHNLPSSGRPRGPGWAARTHQCRSNSHSTGAANITVRW